MELTYPAVIGAARVAFRGLGLRLRVDGDEHVPRSGPVLLASTHVSFLDFLLVGLAAREQPPAGALPGPSRRVVRRRWSAG